MTEKKTKGKQFEPIYVIMCKELSLLYDQCEKLIDKLISPEQRPMALFSPDPKKTEAAIIFDELRTLPFLADKRVVVVKGADKFVTANRELLEKYFDNPSPTGILILAVSSWDSRTKLAKKLPKTGKLIKIAEPKRHELPQRLIKYAQDAYTKNLTRQGATLLVELAGDNLPHLYGEVDKLALYADGEKSITAQHVEQLIGRNRFFNAFEVIDSILAGNIGQALDRLRNMFAADKSTEFTFVGAFSFHLRRMFNAKALLDKGTHPAMVAKKIGIWYNEDAFFGQLRKVTLEGIADLLKTLAETDHAIKTGRTKPRIAAEQLVLKLATA